MKATFPAEEIDLSQIFYRLENVEDTLLQLAQADEHTVFDPNALLLPHRELRRARKALEAAFGWGDEE